MKDTAICVPLRSKAAAISAASASEVAMAFSHQMPRTPASAAATTMLRRSVA